MKKKNVFGMLILFACFASCIQIPKPHYENGWYHILSKQKDSIVKEPIVTVKDFVSLRLDSDGNGTYAIVGQISKHKLKKWADETEKAIGKQIAFVFNDTVITNPQVNARIESGTFQISSHDYNLKNMYNKIRKEKIDSIKSVFKGWDKYFIYYSSKEKVDSLLFSIDYWEASEWVDMSVNSESNYWWGNLDTATYNKLESALREELAKPNFSSRAEDYMKSEAYNKYKAYLCENTYYINFMFQGFLFTEPSAGLCGYLVDDIVRSRYPTAPSIRAMTIKISDQDDETFAKLNYKKAVWRLMNKERDTESNKQ